MAEPLPQPGMAPRGAPWTAIIVGSGFSGLGVAHQMRVAGLEDFVVLERGAALGGTWRDNRYPGCACDVPSYLYSFSWAPKRDWTRTFAPQPEIRAYLEEVADRFDLRRHLRFGAEVIAAEWSDAQALWTVTLAGGEKLQARALVLGTGALSRPGLPALPGLDRFAGARFHSASWNPEVDLRGKRVAVIGTGASAIQFVPRLQPEVARLTLFQRTAPWVLPKPDRPFRAWERRLLRSLPGLAWLYRASLALLWDLRRVAFGNQTRLSGVIKAEALRHLARAIPDPALRAKLTPDYQPGCKRLLLSNDYYPALAQPNVEVITDEIERVEPGGLVLRGGRTVEVDAIVYGTGFQVHDSLGGLTVRGRGGLTLRERWRDGAEAYLGTLVAGFPNLFLMTGPNTGLGHTSMVVMIEGQARLAAQAIALLAQGKAAAVEVKAAAERDFNTWLHQRNARTVWSTGCRSWYLDAAGRNTTLWPGFARTFVARTRRLPLEDLALHR